MSSLPTVVCVKRVKQEAMEDWDETMPLPGDVIEGVAEDNDEELFISTKIKADLSSHLAKISQQFEVVWLKVKRGDATLKLRARIIQEKASILHRKFTVGAATDDRHVVVLGDLTFDQCNELQEMSRRRSNPDGAEFNRRGVKYEWSKKLDLHLPDHRSSVISSILFVPLRGEHSMEATTSRCMAWFCAAVSSGAPLVFVNIQSEQIVNVTQDKTRKTGKESWWSKQQNNTPNLKVVHGIRLWFLPGVSEVPLEMVPASGEVRFGMDIQRTDEGFISVSAVTKGSAADRCGLGSLLEEAKTTNHLLLIARLEGKSVIPSNVSSTGLIHCCDQAEIRSTLTSAMDRMDSVRLHIMALPDGSDAQANETSNKLRTTRKLFP
ncbi:hypothetical protein SDJN03_01688, partial [Cucurbita argyrosperma subsp. sororia]